MEDQIVSAIEISFNPSSVDRDTFAQAFEYINRLRDEPSAWQPCLQIFSQSPRRSQVVRVFTLQVVNGAVQGGRMDRQELQTVKAALLAYLQASYGETVQTTPPDSPSIENKLAQTITFLFAALYANEWGTCFIDLLNLAGNSRGPRANLAGTVFYLRVINSIHDEIGDQLLSRSRPEQDHANVLKDLIRQRDAQKIALSWQEILTQWRDSEDLVAELCLKAIGKWVSWIDISLVVNQSMLELLFQQLQRAHQVDLEEGQVKARDAAIDVFTETVSKKMPAADKLQLISFLNLETVVSQLIACDPLEKRRFSSTYDTDLAEAVAKLVNAIISDIVKILEADPTKEVSDTAAAFLWAFLPHLHRFFSDEYDEVCSTVMSAMSDVLGFLRKSTQGEPVNTQRTVTLLPVLKAIFAKMRYDETSSWDYAEAESDEGEFHDLRKRLATLQQTVAATDERLYTDAVVGLVTDIFEKFRAQRNQVNWRDLELALHEIYLFGDLAVKSGGLYQKNKPNSPAAEKLVQMLTQMVEFNMGSFNHPSVELEYMEICVRYSSFFERHQEYIEPILENFIRCVHHPNLKIKYRAWHLFQRLVRQLRTQVGKVAEIVVQNIQDQLRIATIEAYAADEDSEDSDYKDPDSIFTHQMWLFEAVGCLCGSSSVPIEKQVQYMEALIQPIISKVEAALAEAKTLTSKQDLFILAAHVEHHLLALGELARGYTEYMPGSVVAKEPVAAIKPLFRRASDISLLALTAMNSSRGIREAARHVFGRMIGIIGRPLLHQLPQWIDGFLKESSPESEVSTFLRATTEMSTFLRLLDQVIFGFKNEIFNFLDNFFTSLLQRVFVGLSIRPLGTGDEYILAELKREYLNFLLTILSNDLGGVIISNTNQPIFETVINTVEHFTKDVEDFHTAKMAFQVLTRMCIVWGGPDISSTSNIQTNGNGTAASQPALPNFDQFMITRMSPLCWAMPSNTAFNPKDAQARLVLNEAATLQKTIYLKTGEPYLSWLKDKELPSMGMTDEAMIADYLGKLGSFEMKNWKQFFTKFISQSRNS